MLYKIKYNFNSILEYLLALLTILNYVSIYYIAGFHLIINFFWQVILISLFIKSLKKINKTKLYKIFGFAFIFVSIIFVALLFYYIKYHFNILQMIMLDIIDPIMLITCLFTSSNNNKLNNSLLIKFEKIMLLLSSISLICWVMFSFHILKPNVNISLPSPTGSLSFPGFCYIDFMSQGRISSFLGISNVIRNTSIFSEANGFAYLLCISLFIELFIREHKSLFNWRILLLLLTIFSTTSTNGILIAVPALLYYFIVSSNNVYIKLLCVLLIPISIIFLKFVMSAKAGDVNDITSSYNIRMNDVYASMQAWKNHILTGNGINNISAISQYMYNFRMLIGSTGSSCGILTVLAYGGIIYGLYYIIPVILSLKCSLKIFGFALLSFSLDIFTSEFYSFSYILLVSYIWACILCYNKTFRS